MKSVILAISFFNIQPAAPAVDVQWFDHQAMRDHLASYLKDDRKSVTAVLTSKLQDVLADRQELADILFEQQSNTTQVLAVSRSQSQTCQDDQ